MADLLEEIEVADRVGLDVFGMGEHHRAEFLDSAPAIILAAAAARTKTIRLTSAVTVLSAADPVRVFQEFATLDLISKGRAEIVVGRGSFGGKRRRFQHPRQHPCGREKRGIEKALRTLAPCPAPSEVILDLATCHKPFIFLRFMAGTTGLEPATSAVTGQRSNQLSYVPQVLRCISYCITLIPRGLGKHR